MKEYRLRDPALGILERVDFESVWEIPLKPLDRPNQHHHGFSQVFLWNTQAGSFIVKRQSDYFCRTVFHPLRGIPTVEREFSNLVLLQQKGIPVPRPVYFGCRRKNGHIQAILITSYASDFVSLKTWLSERASNSSDRLLKKEVLTTAGHLIRNFHRLGYCHRHLVPKHILINPNHLPIQMLLIDLESMRKSLPFRRDRQADLASLDHRSEHLSQTDKLRFLFSYLGVSKWTPAAKKFARSILQKSRRKKQKSQQKHKKPFQNENGVSQDFSL